MQFPTRFITKLTLGLFMSTMGPFTYSVIAGQSQTNNALLNKQLYDELVKSKRNLEQGNIQGAKESLEKMKKLTNGAPEYQLVINKLQNEIDKKRGIVGNTRTPQGAKPAQETPSTPTADIDQKDIDAFDDAYDAFDKNKVADMERIIKKIESTPGNSPKKENFLVEAREKLDHLRREHNIPNQKGAISSPKTRTPKGFSDALDRFNLEYNKGLSSANIGSAKDALARMKQYFSGPETDQSHIKQVEEKIKEYEKKAVNGTPRIAPMGHQPHQHVQSPPPPQIGPRHAAKTDISNEDMEVFYAALKKDPPDIAVAEKVLNLNPATPQDSPKKKKFLTEADTLLEVARLTM